MSGVELIGLLLGAIALIEPIGKGLKSVSGVMKSSDSFQEYMLSTSLEYHCHAQAFKIESRRIFGAFLTESEIDDLFGEEGSSDPRWQDQAWRDSVKAYLGTFYDGISTAMLLVSRALSVLNENIVQLKNLNELPRPGDKGRYGGSTASSGQESVSMKIKSKLEIRKEDIKKYFDDLIRYNLLYQGSVNRFVEEQKWNAKATTTIMKAEKRCRHLTKSAGGVPWNSVSQVIDDLHETSRRLSFALQKAAVCSCHAFHLRLEMFSSTDLSTPWPPTRGAPCFGNRDPRYQTINFNLIVLGSFDPQQRTNCHRSRISWDTVGYPLDRLSLRIEVKPHATPNLRLGRTPFKSLPKNFIKENPIKDTSSAQKKPIIRTENGATEPPATTTTPLKAPTPKSKLKKTVALAHNSLRTVVPSSDKRKRKPVAVLEDPRKEPELSTAMDYEVAVDVPVKPEEISDMCAWLKQTRLASNILDQESHPGVLSGESSVQYLVHEENSVDVSPEIKGENHMRNYGSLLEYLLSSRNTLLIPQRMELAHTLAISLLRLHSSSWIRRSWSSKDVMLFLPSDASAAERRWSPYVSAAFNDLRDIQEIAQAENQDEPGYKLSYVVSLGIIFLEIGLSRSLRGEQEDTFNGDPHFDAYMRACGEVKIHSVSGSMGPTYDRVVETCIKWMDSDELDDKAVQQKFYEDVVLGLEKCIQVANSSQKRREKKKRSRS
ncbi:hypothetical protein TWF173_007007 [Orbilia oligospora]|nr:hypothetical protein TWF173_007007 [Orbilia oligospora]